MLQLQLSCIISLQGSSSSSFTLVTLLLFPLLVLGQNETDSAILNNSDTSSKQQSVASPSNPVSLPKTTPTKSPVSNCHLTAEDTEVTSTIKSFISDGATLLKYNLHLENEDILSARLSQNMMYQPLFWVRTTGRQGRSILLLRPEYDVLSLHTLELRVHTLDVTIRQHPRNCLTKLRSSEIEQLLREIVMNDFQNASSGNNIQLSPSESICNMCILNESDVANFRYHCCNRSDTLHIECRILEDEMWLTLLLGVILFIKIIVLLFSPHWIPDSVYRLKENVIPFVYVADQDEPIQLKAVVTNAPEDYTNARAICDVCEFRKMPKFKETIQNMVPDRTYDFLLDKVEIVLKQKSLLNSGSAPVGLFQSLYETFVKCKIREKPSVQACCDANVCLKRCCNAHFSWYRLLTEFMKAMVLVFIALPWIGRVLIYYVYEHDEMEMRKEAAQDKGLQFYFPGTLTLYLTPLHAVFLCMYIVLSLESLLFGVLRKQAKEKMKFILRRCFNDMREFSKQQVLGWLVQILLIPCVSFGIFGIFVAPVLWAIMLPIVVIVVSFYIFPTVNLTGRLLAHFFVYLMPRALYTRFKFSSLTWRFFQGIEDSLKTKVDLKEITKGESVEKNETALRTRRGRCEQLIIIIFCMISLYSCVLLLTEFISFIVEVVVYTMIGIILNASLTLTYLSLALYVVFYANDVIGNVGNRFLSFSATLNAYILGLGKSQAEPVFFKNQEHQLNRAFRVKTGRPCIPKPQATLVQNDVNEPRWKFSKLVLFITNSDQPQIPTKFFFHACNMPYSMVPGQLFSSYLSAFRELGVIMIFLVFVLIVVLAFGESYELSASNHLLATIVSGFLPLVLRRVLFKSHSVPSIDTSSDINFQVCMFDLLNTYEQSWPIHDIDANPEASGNTISEGLLTADGLDASPTAIDSPEKTLGDEKANTEETTADEIDLVIDIRYVDDIDFPKMYRRDDGGTGSASFVDEGIELTAV